MNVKDDRLILTPGPRVLIPSSPRGFVAKQKFRFSPRRTSYGGILCNNNFIRWYLEGDSEIEEPVGERIIQSHTLQEISSDDRIITQRGGIEGSETMLRDMHFMIQSQRKGRLKIFLQTGAVNVFYIRDQCNKLRAILLFWFRSWCIDAYPLNACVREKGSRVFTFAHS